MIAIVDYGVGNLRSVQKAFERLGHDAVITALPSQIEQAHGVILPGVGAFGDAMNALLRLHLIDPILAVAKDKKPLLGICLGMQLLFSTSEEYGEHDGLNLIAGSVVRMHGDMKVPHVGWNQLQVVQNHPIVQDIDAGEHAYFVHSYYVKPESSSVIVATTDYGTVFPSIVAFDNIIGVQFHPEKSSNAGLRMLDNFARLCLTGGGKR